MKNRKNISNRCDTDHYIVRNRILSTLSPEHFELLRPLLSREKLKKNTVINEANRPIDSMYFIESGIVSRIARTSLDGAVEVAVVGQRGLIGVSLLLESQNALHRTIVQIEGEAFKVAARDIADLLNREPEIRRHFLQYVNILIQQKAQVALCNAKHELDMRLARWLMHALDRIDGDELPITHDALASMLGVRRPGVSDALARLESRGIILKARGTLKVLQREALQNASCECYRIIRDRYQTQDILPRFEHIWL